MSAVLFTIGHSTHHIEVFLRLLERQGIARLVDVRAIPASRRHPQFGRDVLRQQLVARGIEYLHASELGGLRTPLPGSSNTGWQQAGFRGFADYMQTAPFVEALQGLMGLAGESATAIMCAEARWWECHRRLIADAASVRGVDVRHITSAGSIERHELTSFARVGGVTVVYPGLV